MPIFRLYDTLSRKVRPLEPLEPDHLRFYTCGPTVYSYAHIGNFRSFVAADLVVRTAKALGWRVSWITNITDVGHLSEDDVADAGGEDRMEKALRSKEGEHFANVWDLAEHYALAYLEDWRALNLSEPLVRPRATQHVREQIVMTQALIEKGNAYETPTGVYFDVDSFPDYGKLSGNTRGKLLDAVRDVVQDENKRQQADFALWKKDDKHLMQWFSPWGWGFPGWHIECSAMARAYLGDVIDLHSGGEDNAFPHHECEIAQTEAYTGRPFSRHWMHVRHLQVEGEKMAKSAGNFFTIRDLVAQGHDPLAVRYALISTPYGRPFNFTMQLLRDAAANVGRFRECERRIRAAGVDPLAFVEESGADELGRELAEDYAECLAAMCDDLNTSVALAKAVEGAKAILRVPSLDEANARSAAWFLRKVNELLGIVRNDAPLDPVPDTGSREIEGRPIEEWVAERTAAKASRDFDLADSIRAKLAEAGIELRDTPAGTEWSALG
ncbi:MAG: cysteine--tRNA ligase [Fimbriimonadaceae bacterium]|nr:cysteine--tRNA ligase [Fimbriimonadaceae bacterium]